MIFLILNYMNVKEVVTEVNTPYRLLKVVKTIIPFDDIYSVELLAKGILFYYSMILQTAAHMGGYLYISLLLRNAVL